MPDPKARLLEEEVRGEVILEPSTEARIEAVYWYSKAQATCSCSSGPEHADDLSVNYCRSAGVSVPSESVDEKIFSIEKQIFCIKCEHCGNLVGSKYRCQHETALLFRSLVDSEMPTCEDMRSNNGRGCAPTATWFKAKKATAKGKKK